MRFVIGYCLVFLFIVSSELLAQQDILLNKYSISSLSVPKGSYSQQILTSLALANAKDLKSIEVIVDYNLRSELLRVDGCLLEVKLIITGISLSGDIDFRDFSIANKIIPDFAQLKVDIYSQEEIFETKIIEIPLNNISNTIILELDKAISKTNAGISVLLTGFSYSAETFKKYEHYNNLVNNYYGYSLLLTSLNKELHADALKSKEDIPVVFIQWHETSRILSLLDAIKLEDFLPLEDFDPEDFIKKQNNLKRYHRRATTLKNKILNNELEIGFTIEKQKYINGLLELSVEYYKKSKTLQPYLKEPFFKTVLLNENADELKVIRLVSEYFDTYAYGEQIIVPLALNNLFITNAREYLDKSKNIMALQQLKNAKIIQEFFKLPQSEFYLATLAITLNGLIESYLKVSSRAFESANFVMAENYYQNAEKVFRENRELFEETNIIVTPFSIYIETQKILAKQLLTKHKYEDAEKLIENCNKIIQEKGLTESTQQKELLIVAQNGIFRNKIAAAKKQLFLNNIEQARVIIYEADSYNNLNTNSYYKKRFENLAYSVFLEYLQIGEILLDEGNHNEAIINLHIAKNIQKDILGYEVLRLDELLKNASVPLIREMVDKAIFYTWAKKTDEANLILLEAKQIQEDYHQQQNDEVNTALEDLENRIDNRHCIDLEFRIKENTNLFLEQIVSGKFEEALQTKSESFSLDELNKECNLCVDKIDSINKKYQDVFVFWNDYNSMKDSLYNKGYSETIELYIKLRKSYFEKNIEELNFTLLPLYDFVKYQNLSGLTKSTISCFIHKEQYLTAFEYLKLLKEQGMEYSDTKELQIQLGTLYSQSLEVDLDTKRNMQEEMTNNDKWFKYFTKAMNKK